MDKDGNGVLDKMEFRDGYRKFYGVEVDDDVIDELFDEIDEDGSGEIDFNEFT